jgi:putative ABC transport system permease protein
MAAAVGLALLSPGLTRMTAALLRRPVRAVTGTAGYLATLNCRARTVQIAATVTPVMLAVGVATANLYVQTTQTELTERAFTENLRADTVLTSVNGTVGPDLVERVRRLPGVVAASAYVSSVGYLEKPGGGAETGSDGMPLQGVSAAGAAGTTAVAASHGGFDRLRGDSVALPESAGHGVGDVVTLRLGDNSAVRVEVVATYLPRAGSTAALLPVDLLAPHTTEGLARQILVRAGADVSPALRDLVASEPGLRISSRAELVAAQARDARTQAWITYLLVGMIVAYTAISVVNSLALATGNRRREFGLQRLTGATKAQVMRMMTVESLIVAMIGVVLGTAASATTLVPFAHAAGDGSRWLPYGPLWIYGAVVAVATVLSLSATLVPTWRSLRVRPAVAAVAGTD